MQEFTDAIASIPASHFGMFIGLTAVVGGLLLGGFAIWRGIWLQARLMEARSHLILEMLKAGLSSREILAILDHPSMTTMSGRQMKHSRTLLTLLENQTKPPRAPAELEVESVETELNRQILSQ